MLLKMGVIGNYVVVIYMHRWVVWAAQTRYTLRRNTASDA